MSTCAAKCRGFPLSLLSAATNSSILFSIPSEIFTRILLRSSSDILDHIGKAFSAAFTANSTSSESESGIKEYTFPVPGS